VNARDGFGTGCTVLSVNAGSSSLKFALHPVAADGGVQCASLSGLAEGLEPGGPPRIRLQRDGATLQSELAVGPGTSGFDVALRKVIQSVQGDGAPLPMAVAHRVVHGGERCRSSVVIDDVMMDYLDSLAPLAPLHQPHNLAGVRAFQRALPGVPQVACFDTAFHAGAPEEERTFALPEAMGRAGIQRYGFHGLSYAYCISIPQLSRWQARGRVLMAHLGNGASLCAARDGRSVATTMGFSALDGLMMGTRSGALDPGVLLHLLRQGMGAEAIEELLYKKSGLLGVSGISADMRTLRASDAPAAARAIRLFTYRVVRESGALVAVLGGLDALVFTGGIGEHDRRLRSDVCRALGHLGIALDDARNDEADGCCVASIHAQESAVEVWVVPTDEGRVAARDAVALLALTGPAEKGIEPAFA